MARAALAAGVLAALAGCGTFDSYGQKVATAFTPYKIEVVQGNFVSREQVEALKPGMSHLQVREILGTPLVTSLFHSERWDYVFTLRRQGVDPQQRKLTLWFKQGVLERFEGDTMPSEAEFVATLDNRRKSARIPPLEASEDKLKQFERKPGETAASAPAAPAAPQAPLPATYPPLEPPAR
jgi:outer membrane protein assembly factor BamE